VVSFTPKQGQYLAFIYYYIKINGRSPSEADMETYFKVTAASINQMGRKPRKARGLSPERPDKAARLSCDCHENNCRISNNVRANIYYADAHMLFLLAVPPR
jgi:repressor LexA